MFLLMGYISLNNGLAEGKVAGRSCIISQTGFSGEADLKYI